MQQTPQKTLGMQGEMPLSGIRKEERNAFKSARTPDPLSMSRSMSLTTLLDDNIARRPRGPHRALVPLDAPVNPIVPPIELVPLLPTLQLLALAVSVNA